MSYYDEDGDDLVFGDSPLALVRDLARIELTDDTPPRLREFVYRARDIVSDEP